MTSKIFKKNLLRFVIMLILISVPRIDIFLIMSIFAIIVGKYLYKFLFPTTNVYCSGVFDLCHVGHKKMFENAKKYGNKLFVGVHSDKNVESYKRTPIMTMDERCEAVKHCKYVDAVLPNASLWVTRNDIKKNNIHIVVCSPEYYNETDDKKGYYSLPRKLKILRLVPYSNEISTSELLKRMQDRNK